MIQWSDYNLPCLRLGTIVTGGETHAMTQFYYDFRVKRVTRGFMTAQCAVTLSRKQGQGEQFLKMINDASGKIIHVAPAYQKVAGEALDRYFTISDKWRMSENGPDYVTVNFTALLIPEYLAKRTSFGGCPKYPSNKLYPSNILYPC